MQPKIIQLQPWRDLLLALTDTGEIYRLEVFPGSPQEVYRISVDAVPLFPGFPPNWRRP